jgi:hypothetical protein
MDGHLGLLHILTNVNSSIIIGACRCLFDMLVSFCLAIYPEVRIDFLLVCVVLCVVVLEIRLRSDPPGLHQ